MEKYKPFDPSDDADVIADNFRVEVCEMASRAMTMGAYKRLSSTEQIETFMGGVLVGLIGVCFSHIRPEGREAMMEAITDYLPQARDQAEAMIEEVATAERH